jgi:PRTRC genetic system ThiF family protein
MLRTIIPRGSVAVYLIGCGGTGSFIAQDIARIAYHLQGKEDLKIVFIDNDKVEKKNVGRQNFVESEIGQNKADVLAFRYNRAYGLEIISVSQKVQEIFSSETFPRKINIFVGAVDNTEARKFIAQCVSHIGREGEDEYGREFAKTTYWLDCGNETSSGQVLLGNAKKPGKLKELSINLISRIPFPHIQAPELIKKQPKPKLSCAELAIREEQSLLVNRAMATFAAQYLYDILVKKEITKYATYISLGGCSASSKILTPTIWDNMEHLRGKKGKKGKSAVGADR